MAGPEPFDVEFLDPAPEPGPLPGPPRRRNRGPLLGLAALVAAGLVAVVAGALVRHEDSSRAPQSAAGSPAPVVSPVVSPVSLVAPPPVQVDGVGHPLLGVSAGWELFGLGDGVVVQVEFAAGRVTTTALGPLLSSGPVSLLPTPDGVIVRPLDGVPGYAIVTGHTPVGLTGLLGQGGATFPGPSADRIWVEGAGDRLVLATLAGRPAGPGVASLRLPAGASAQGAASDQRGGVVVFTQDASVDLTSHGSTRVTPGDLLGIGPRTWLVVDCRTCPLTVVDRETGIRHALPRAPVRGELGPVSPDGRLAALAQLTDDGSPSVVRLLDLTTGAEQVLPGHVSLNGYIPSSVVWSPDSRWLFLLDPDGVLTVIDARTGGPVPLGVRLPPLTQLAVRS